MKPCNPRSPRESSRRRRAAAVGRAFALLAASVACNHAWAQAAVVNLCLPGETVWFSCRIGQTKMASLCGTTQTLQYRFGTPRRLELQFPSDATKGFTSFQWAHYSRSKVDRMEVGFDNRGVSYLLFDYTEGAQRTAGVEVNTTRRLPCVDAPQGRLSPLKNKLPCDEDSALNLGHCPAT